LRAAADAVLCLHNQHVSRLLDDQTRASEIFTAANELWAEGIGGILQMLTRRGLIQVEFADLAAMLRGRKAMSCFASVQVTGEARGKELMERLLVHPLLEGGRALLEADALLVNLTGGPDLTMADVNFVMDQVRRQSENAQFAMGASICDEFAGRLRVTIIAAKHGKPDDLAKDAVLSAGAETKASETSEDDRQIETQFFTPPELSRSSARFVPPPPDLSTEKKDQMFAEQSGKGGRVRRAASRLRQGQLPLEIVSKSRFEKSHPTIHRGEDLDVPTYIRRGIKLN